MANTPTTIVNLRHHGADIDCGRSSIFGNPFDYRKLGITRDECCDRFKTYFYGRLHNDPKFKEQVHALKGKRLGCWCKCEPHCGNPNCKSHRCHLEIIVEYIESTYGLPPKT